MSPPIDFQQLFESSPNPYMLLDRELRYVAANAAYQRVTNSSLAQLLGRSIFEAFPNDPEDPRNEPARLLRESFERVLETRERDILALIPYRVPLQTERGLELTLRYWSATHTPIFDAKGEVAYILQHTEDVTELEALKQRAAEAVRERPGSLVGAGVLRRAQLVQEANVSLESERQYLRRMFEQAPGFMAFLRGPNHVFELANSSYFQVVGHDRNILGMTVREALPEVAGQGFFEILDRVFATGEPFVGRGMRVMLQKESDAPASEVFLDFVYQPIFAPDQQTIGIFVQGHDITEQKRAEDELRRYRDHLEELVRERTRELEASEAERRAAEAALRHSSKMEAVGKLTGGVAHDFNNLLQVIGGNLQLLQREATGQERMQRRLTTAYGAVQRGARLAAQLLAFARRQPLEPAPLDLGRLLHGMDDLLRRSLGEEISIGIEVEPGVWPSFADPHQLENVILNLAINARDAMENQGRLELRLRNAVITERDAATLPDVAPGSYVELSVADTGCGMTREVMERAFEPFFTTKPEGRGTGLGLSMVYGFAKQSGGHVQLESEPGKGTTIRLFLPRAEREQAPISEPLALAVEGGTETLLVVEDDPDVRSTAVAMLSELGYRVLEAEDGAAALEVLKRGTPVDLLFTDVVMPGPVTSTELAKQAKSLMPEVEVLFSSGYAQDEIVHGGRLDPGVNLLMKPYRREELARKLRHVLRNREQRRKARGSGERPMVRPQTPSSLHILLVEDDEQIRASTHEALTELGHRVTSVESAEDAQQALADTDFDVLFTDASLPGLSGPELARRVIEATPEMPVIIASGHGADVIGDAAERLAQAVLLQKPYDLRGIQNALNEARIASGSVRRPAAVRAIR